MNDWISVKDRLPDEGVPVLIFLGSRIEIAKIEIGISENERQKMKSGELPDRETFGYIPGRGVFTIKRSDEIKGCDEWGNNLVPYKWYAQSGPMEWWGQNISHWMPLPDRPEGNQ